jgi:hypothetical protein
VTSFTLKRRAQTPHSTWGEFLAEGEAAPLCKILERGAGNPDHVRIPAGTYEVRRKPVGTSHFDARFRALLGDRYKGILWLPDVPHRTNIEIHTANQVSELLGCLATGVTIVQDAAGDFAVAGGTSMPAYALLYPAVSAAIDSDGAALVIEDVPA